MFYADVCGNITDPQANLTNGNAVLNGSIVTDQYAELTTTSLPQCSRDTAPEPPYTYPPMPPSPAPPPP